MKRLVVCIGVLVSTPAFAEQRLGAPCSLGYGASGTWSQVPDAPPGVLMCAQGFNAQPGPAWQPAPDWQQAPEVRVPEVPYQPADRPLQSDQTDNAQLRAAKEAATAALNAAQEAARAAINNELNAFENLYRPLGNESLSSALTQKSVNPAGAKPPGANPPGANPPGANPPVANPPVGYVDPFANLKKNQGQLSPDNCKQLGVC